MFLKVWNNLDHYAFVKSTVNEHGLVDWSSSGLLKAF